MSTQDFYDELAPFYHLIYPDWEASSARQAAALDVTCYALPVDRLVELMREAGFTDVRRMDGAFFQPLVALRRAAEG